MSAVYIAHEYTHWGVIEELADCGLHVFEEVGDYLHLHQGDFDSDGYVMLYREYYGSYSEPTFDLTHATDDQRGLVECYTITEAEYLAG